MVDGVEVELFLNPPAGIRHAFEERESSTIGMFARGRIVHDPVGVVADLMAQVLEPLGGVMLEDETEPGPWPPSGD